MNFRLQARNLVFWNAAWQRWVLVGWVLVVIAVGVGSVVPGAGPPVPWSSPYYTHFFAYGFLALVPVALNPRAVLAGVIIIGLSAYGGAIEIIQHFLPHRFGSWADAGVNFLGAATGAMIGLGIGMTRVMRRIQV